LKALYPNSKIICEEDDSKISPDIKACIQPDQLLKLRTTNELFTPELLQKSSRLRRVQYQKYLNDLLELNEEFLEASDVKRGLS